MLTIIKKVYTSRPREAFGPEKEQVSIGTDDIKTQNYPKVHRV
jgi:hypothetical protein